jgi:hypothetical protein
MEAPEKIYIYNFGSELSHNWHTNHSCEKDIEYVRKDAFVKKAVKHINGLIEFLKEFGHQLKKECIIEDFKKHIES